MAPDDLVKPGHISIAIAALTPKSRPAGMTDHLYRLIHACAATDPKMDAVEIRECLTTGSCSKKTRMRVSLPMVLFVLARSRKPSAARRNRSGRGQ
jgi:hypothetical protein